LINAQGIDSAGWFSGRGNGAIRSLFFLLCVFAWLLRPAAMSASRLRGIGKRSVKVNVIARYPRFRRSRNAAWNKDDPEGF
jgi:hypothetical protein